MNFIFTAISMFISSAQADSSTSHILDFTLLDIEVQENLPTERLTGIHICPPSLLEVRDSFISEIYTSIGDF